MKSKLLKGKLRSGSSRRRVRKSKKPTLLKVSAPGPKEILRELNGAKTRAHTRHAFAIAKLFGSAVPTAYSSARKWGNVGKKILLHPLPPCTSVAATALIMVWALVGLGVSALSGFNATKLSAPPAKNILAVSRQSKFSPAKDFKNSLASFKESINNQLALLVSQTQALTPLQTKANLVFIYYHAPVKLSPSQTQVLPTQAKQTAPGANNFLPPGRVLGVSTVKKLSSSPVKSAGGSLSLPREIEKVLNSYLVEGKFAAILPQAGKPDPAASQASVVNNGNGITTLVVGGNPIVSYVPAAAANNFSGATLSGFGGNNSADLTPQNASISENLNVSGATTLSSLMVSGNSNLATTTVSGNLTIGGNVGIGTTTPASALSVNGDINFTGNLYRDGNLFSGGGGSSQWTTAGSAVYYNNGYVGIGTTSPTQALTLNGNALFAGHMSLGNVGGVNNEIENYGDPLEQRNNSFPTNLNIDEYRSGDISYNNANYQENLTVYPSFNNTSSSAGSIYSVDVEPEVTASSTGPFTTLDGSYYTTTNDGVGTVTNQTSVTGEAFNYNSGTVTNLTGLYGYAENNSTGNVNNSYGIYTDPAFNEGSGVINNAYGIYVAQPTNSGTVGNNYGLYVSDQSGITATGSNFNIYSAGQGINYFGGNVGIGTSSPVATFSVNGNEFIAGSSTITSLNSGGIVQSTASGQLYNSAVALGSQVSGVLGVGNGGTGITTAPVNNGQLLMASSTGWTVGSLVAGTNITITTSTPGQITIAASGGGGSPGGSNGEVQYNNAGSFGGSGDLFDNGTVSGVNATSSTVSFNIQGTGTINPFNVASSSGGSLLTVLANGNVGIGTSSPANVLDVYGNATANPFNVSSSSTQSILEALSTNGVVLSMNASSTNSGTSVASTVPVLQLGPTALTAPSANGTYFGMNAPTNFSGNFLQFQNNGTSELSVSSAGAVTAHGAGAFGGSISAGTVTLAPSGDFYQSLGNTTCSNSNINGQYCWMYDTQQSNWTPTDTSKTSTGQSNFVDIIPFYQASGATLVQSISLLTDQGKFSPQSVNTIVKGQWMGALIAPTFGNGNVAYDSIATIPTMAALQISPTINVRSSSTVGYAALLIQPTETSTSTATNYVIQSGTSLNNNMFDVTDAGNVGIGTATPVATFTLQGSGTTTPFMIYSSGGTTLMTVAPSGDVTITGSATTCTLGNGTSGTNCSSDERLKTNITPINDALDKLSLINGVTFNWADPSKDQGQFVGVIAQNVLNAFPQAVSTSTVVFDGVQGNYYSVDYGALVGPVISGVNELNARTNFATTATTSALELTAAASNVSTASPWIGDFASASMGLQAAIQSIGSQIIHVFDQAIYATTGIFDKVFAKEVHTDELCVGSTCVTQAQFLQMVQQAAVNQNNNNPYTARQPAADPVADPVVGNPGSADGSYASTSAALVAPDPDSSQPLSDSSAAVRAATSTPDDAGSGQ